MRCEICGKGPAPEDGGVTIYRQNGKGVKGIWRCQGCNRLPIDPEVREIVNIIERRED